METWAPGIGVPPDFTKPWMFPTAPAEGAFCDGTNALAHVGGEVVWKRTKGPESNKVQLRTTTRNFGMLVIVIGYPQCSVACCDDKAEPHGSAVKFCLFTFKIVPVLLNKTR